MPIRGLAGSLEDFTRVGLKPIERLRASRGRQCSEVRKQKRAKQKTLLSEWRSLLKNWLTEPTLLEMSGNRVNQELRPFIRCVPIHAAFTANCCQTVTSGFPCPR